MSNLSEIWVSLSKYHSNISVVVCIELLAATNTARVSPTQVSLPKQHGASEGPTRIPHCVACVVVHLSLSSSVIVRFVVWVRIVIVLPAGLEVHIVQIAATTVAPVGAATRGKWGAIETEVAASGRLILVDIAKLGNLAEVEAAATV